MIMEFISNKKGTASLVLLCLLLPIFATAFFGLVEYHMILTEYSRLEQAVTISALSALAYVDPIVTAYGDADISPAKARQVFDSLFETNARVTSGVFAVPPRVEEFRVFSLDDLPAICTREVQLIRPTIHVIVSAELSRPVLKRFGLTFPLKVHKDVDNLLLLSS